MNPILVNVIGTENPFTGANDRNNGVRNNRARDGFDSFEMETVGTVGGDWF